MEPSGDRGPGLAESKRDPVQGVLDAAGSCVDGADVSVGGDCNPERVRPSRGIGRGEERLPARPIALREREHTRRGPRRDVALEVDDVEDVLTEPGCRERRRPVVLPAVLEGRLTRLSDLVPPLARTDRRVRIAPSQISTRGAGGRPRRALLALEALWPSRPARQLAPLEVLL